MSRGNRAALEVLLTDAAAGGRPGLPSLPTAARLGAGLVRRPHRVARRATRFVRDEATILAGRSAIAPARSDRRFADRAWTENPLLHRTLQQYLALTEALDGLVTDADLAWAHDVRARFALDVLVDAVAPTNVPWLNPTVLKETLDRGGANLVRGGRRALRDARARRLPATVDSSRFEVGRNLAATPGAVVLRTELFELLHYEPQTDEVAEVPLLVVPPAINRYYVLDLAPGRSLIEHLVGAGQQVFVISWRNPEPDHGGFDLDTYAAAVLEARDAVSAITGSGPVGVQGVCSGGIVAACALNHLAAEGRLQDSVAHLALLVCLLDARQAGTTTALVSREVAAAAAAQSARTGYIDGESFARVFAWLRPNDLVWNYVVNNYFLGKDPPAFDVLHWNQDTVRMPAGLHRDFLRIAIENPFAEPGEMTVLGSPVDLRTLDVPTYVVAGKTDHIVPADTAWRSARLLGDDVRFVLSSSGHVQALVNPATPDSRSSYQVTSDLDADRETWQAGAPRQPGSWWTDYTAWLDERSGARHPAPAALGDEQHPASARAPGTFVHAA